MQAQVIKVSNQLRSCCVLRQGVDLGLQFDEWITCDDQGVVGDVGFKGMGVDIGLKARDHIELQKFGALNEVGVEPCLGRSFAETAFVLSAQTLQSVPESVVLLVDAEPISAGGTVFVADEAIEDLLVEVGFVFRDIAHVDIGFLVGIIVRRGGRWRRIGRWGRWCRIDIGIVHRIALVVESKGFWGINCPITVHIRPGVNGRLSSWSDLRMEVCINEMRNQ